MSTNYVSEIPVKHIVRVEYEVEVEAYTRKDAIKRAQESIGATGLEEPTLIRCRRDWMKQAGDMIKAGMSHSEVAETLGASRSEVTRKFKGRGYTRKQGVEFRKMQRQLDELGDFL